MFAVRTTASFKSSNRKLKFSFFTIIYVLIIVTTLAILLLLVSMSSSMHSADSAHTDLVKGVKLVSVSSSMHWNVAARTDLAKKVCKQTLDYVGCLITLGSDPRSRAATDLSTLAAVCLDQAKANTTNSLKFVRNICEDPRSSPSLKSVLGLCVDNYKYSVNSFDAAANELKVDPQSASYNVKVAGDGPWQCRDELAKHGFGIPEISKRNKYAMLYSNIGFVIINSMPPSPPSLRWD